MVANYGRQKNYYSTHNFTTGVSTGAKMSVHYSDVYIWCVQILVGFYCTANESRGLCSSNGRQLKHKSSSNSTTKVSFSTKISRLGQHTTVNRTV